MAGNSFPVNERTSAGDIKLFRLSTGLGYHITLFGTSSRMKDGAMAAHVARIFAESLALIREPIIISLIQMVAGW